MSTCHRGVIKNSVSPKRERMRHQCWSKSLVCAFWSFGVSISVVNSQELNAKAPRREDAKNSRALDLFESFLCVLAPWRLRDEMNLNLLDFVGNPFAGTKRAASKLACRASVLLLADGNLSRVCHWLCQCSFSDFERHWRSQWHTNSSRR